MNLFQTLTVGGLSVLVLVLASSVPANACDKNKEVKNPQEVVCKTKLVIKHGNRQEVTTCKTNKEWKEQQRGCELKRIDIFGGR